MKILFTRFPLESRYGGAEVQTMSLMRGLLGRGHAVAFLGSCPTLLRLCDEEGFPAAQLEIGPPPVTKWSAITFAWRRRAMQEKLEAALNAFGSLDAVVMLSFTEKVLLTPFALKKGLRVIWIEHDRVGPWLRKNPWLSTMLELSRSVTTVTVSELSKRLYVAMGWDPQHVIAVPNGIDESRLTHNGGTYAAPPRDGTMLRVGTVARLTADKGVDILMQAIADIPEADCTIIGDGPEEGYLRRIISDLTARESSHRPRIRLLRNVDDLGAFYRSLDVFVLPSREHDPFGLVAGEAMISGTATIVTDACGIASYLTSGEEAVVVQANDRELLQHALQGLLQREVREEIAQRGQRMARVKFSVSTMVEAYERVLQP